MATISENSLIEQLNWRYAVKRFDSTKKIPGPTIEALEQSLVLSPSSYGLQTWKFFIIQKPDLLTKLRAASWNQSQVEDCSHYVVMAYRHTVDENYISKYISEIAIQRQVTEESLAGFKKGMIADIVNGPRKSIVPVWSSRQVYIALGSLMTSAALLGVDSCPIEGLDPAIYDDILGLKNSEYRTVVACALGYRHPEDRNAQKKKVRFSKGDLIEHI